MAPSSKPVSAVGYAYHNLAVSRIPANAAGYLLKVYTATAIGSAAIPAKRAVSSSLPATA